MPEMPKGTAVPLFFPLCAYLTVDQRRLKTCGSKTQNRPIISFHGPGLFTLCEVACLLPDNSDALPRGA